MENKSVEVEKTPAVAQAARITDKYGPLIRGNIYILAYLGFRDSSRNKRRRFGVFTRA